jgi:hypothetical protein
MLQRTERMNLRRFFELLQALKDRLVVSRNGGRIRCLNSDCLITGVARRHGPQQGWQFKCLDNSQWWHMASVMGLKQSLAEILVTAADNTIPTAASGGPRYLARRRAARRVRNALFFRLGLSRTVHPEEPTYETTTTPAPA